MARKISIGWVTVHISLWILLTFILLYLVYDYDAPFLQQFISVMVVTGLTAIPAYISSKVLVPRMLYNKVIGKFIGALFLTAIVNTLVTYYLGGALYYVLSGRSIFSSGSVIRIISIYFFVINCIVISMSCAIKIISDHYGMEKHLHKVEDEKEITELAFLRAQINPHFLFNVLNMIYFQINRENDEARNSIEKLSEMLRYQLYECTTDMIDISKELAYIENYVAMQHLRMETGTDLKINIPENFGSFKIAPLLILPLVENAFKHISNFKEPSRNKLYISIYIEYDKHFVVNVVNTYNESDQTDHLKKSNGLGLQNLERRLSLLYPGKHFLTRKRNENTYETTLNIQYID